MKDYRKNIVGCLALAGTSMGLVGCSTVEVEMTGPRSYVTTAPAYGLGPGPSLVAGDQLAYRMVLAGAYDAPSAFEGTGYATVPVTDD